MNFQFYRSLCVLMFLTAAITTAAQTTRLVSTTGSNSGNCVSAPCASINYAIGQAIAGDVVLVNDGVYSENVLVNKNIIIRSVNGAANAIIDGSNNSTALGAIQLTPGRSGVVIGSAGQGFTILGIDGAAGLEKAAIYLQGNQSNISIEGNDIVARGDYGLLCESSAFINGLFINNNIFSGTTFIGAPAGDGFASQFTLPNVPRQAVVIGSGAGTTKTENITFTNNTINATSGGISTTDNSGVTVAPHEQGNSLITIDAVGSVIITGNNFSGTTTNIAEALRARGAGAHTITGNTMMGSYPRIFTSATNPITVGEARAQSVYNNNTMNGTLSGHIIYNACTPFSVSIADVNTVSGQENNTIFIGYGPQSVTLDATIVGDGTYSYVWTSNRGGTFPESTSITVSPDKTTTYTFTATGVATGCTRSASITIMVIDIRDGNSKVLVCCNGKTNSIANSAVSAHLAHGDILGACVSSMRKTDHAVESKLNIYPNPSNGKFTIELSSTDPAQITIMDQQGRVIEVQSAEGGANTIQIDLNGKAKGIYFIEVNTNDDIVRQKLVIQ